MTTTRTRLRFPPPSAENARLRRSGSGNQGDVAELDGVWNVVRSSGALPPLLAVRKEIDGTRGVTRVGVLPGVPFQVDGLRLRYRRPFSDFVDELEPAPDGFRGRATFRGREFGRFVMRRHVGS